MAALCSQSWAFIFIISTTLMELDLGEDWFLPTFVLQL